MSPPTDPLPTDAELMMPVIRVFGALVCLMLGVVCILDGFELATTQAMALESCGQSAQKSARMCRNGASLMALFPASSQGVFLAVFGIGVGAAAVYLAWRLVSPMLFKRKS